MRGHARSQTLVSLQSQFSDAATDCVSQTPVLTFVAVRALGVGETGLGTVEGIGDHLRLQRRGHAAYILRTRCGRSARGSRNGGATRRRRGSGRCLHIARATRLV
jgi:hypothetical protein